MAGVYITDVLNHTADNSNAWGLHNNGSTWFVPDATDKVVYMYEVDGGDYIGTIFNWTDDMGLVTRDITGNGTYIWMASYDMNATTRWIDPASAIVLSATLESTTTHDIDIFFGTYNISLLDEDTGLDFNTSQVNSAVLEVICPGLSKTTHVFPNGTSVFNNLTLTCNPDEMRVIVEGDDETDVSYTYYRTQVPVTTSGINELDFYLINLTNRTFSTDVVLLAISIDDITGAFTGAQINVLKDITSGGETINQGTLDAANKVLAYLIVSERYDIELDNGVTNVSERYTPTLTETSFTFSPFDLSFTSGVTYTYRSITWGFVSSNTTGTIGFVYNDTLNLTETIHISFINTTSMIIINSTRFSARSNVFYGITGLNINDSYRITFGAVHTEFGAINDTKLVVFAHERIFGVEGITDFGYAMAASFLVVILLLSFGRRFAPAGALVASLFIGLFMMLGWFNVFTSVMALFIIVILLLALIVRRKR